MTAKKTIMCVDDDALALLLLSKVMGHVGLYDIVEAKSGYECLELISQQPVDLIILDYELGDINGLEVCKLLPARSINPDVPVIISSVVDSADIMNGHAPDNLVKVVQKPYTPAQLCQDLDEIFTPGDVLQ